ncbi:cysteine proteinase inhibitor 1-like [Olea europaea var. sylvestris]|uniref:Cysteine ase inhibitor 1-like n=1 Tax=Olea europaea subsp. europaea TaxID=158383 RepID=A0A8S0VEF3_OLEEU|nr:cysteine proteinase inhibitor 1-like [Olea europaea var. sylvestris]CAA3028511.1 cysteine ase inhibitor 1-like [Olea europaea subsp. europaea]
MALKSRSLFLIILPILVASISIEVSAAQSGGRGPIVGGYKPIDNPNDPTVIEIAKFAVDEHNKEAKSNLEFQKVVKGESQVVAGINYKLVISAVDGAAVQNYLAVIYEKPWQNFKSLTSFEKYAG